MRHQLLAIEIILLLCGITLIPIHSTGEEHVNSTIYVDDDNTEGPWDGSQEHPYQCIQDGIDNADDGDTVFVYNGTYYEHIIVNKSVNLIGENKNTSIIDGRGLGDVVYISSDEVDICGFTIQNSGNHGWPTFDSGIHVGAENNRINDNKVMYCEYGIFIWLGGVSNNNSLYRNVLINNGVGVYVDFFSWNNNISRNEITNNTISGIIINDHSLHNKITGNIIGGNGYNGIFLGSYFNTVNCNKISNNRRGIYLIGHDNNILGNSIIGNNDSGIFMEYSDNNIVKDNIITENDNDGVFIYFGFENLITCNLIKSNSNVGIRFVYVFGGVINGNTVRNNNFGVYLNQSSNNTVTSNNFISNKKSAYFKDCDNIWNGNYWNRPRFLPKLIYGTDVFNGYTIPWVNADGHPAWKPYDIRGG